GHPQPLFADLQEQLDRMEKGLDMVLYMSRLESFELDFFLEKIDVLELLNEVLRDHRRLFIRNEIYPSVEAEQGLVIISDRKWLSFILS
ncbi:sensor histidine kinase, partial [Alkalihalophilus lindianensis]|nr:sensor histidine kinase [Alkalihalophilus lindianensis]